MFKEKVAIISGKIIKMVECGTVHMMTNGIFGNELIICIKKGSYYFKILHRCGGENIFYWAVIFF